LLDKRRAGEHPYVVGWAKSAAMVFVFEEGGERRAGGERAKDRACCIIMVGCR